MMRPSEARDDTLQALKERKRLLDDVWLLALLVLFLAVGVPWYLRILEVNFAPVAWSLFGFGALYVAASVATDSLRSRRSLLLAVTLLQAAGVLLLGLVWHWTGGLQNPMFLLVFVLPVVAGSFLLVSWHSYATVLLAVATVAAVALINAPDLRWYLAQAGSLPDWASRLLPEAPASAQPFPSLHAPPAYSALMLASFTVLLFTVALVSESVTTLLLRLYKRLDASTRALGVAEDLSFEVLRASPSPAALIYADTMHVAQASQSFQEQFFLNADSLLGRPLLDLVRFAHPEVIAELLSGDGGEVFPAICHVDAETRVARVRAEPIQFGGRVYVYVNIQDMSEQQFLQAALDSLDVAVVVLSDSKRIVAFNPAAVALFGALEAGAEADASLRLGGFPEGWWETGLRARLERTLEAGGKRWNVVCATARILSEKNALTIATLRQAGGER
jgi:PAS domain-containing protein